MKNYTATDSIGLNRYELDTRRLIAEVLKQRGIGLSQSDVAALIGKSRSWVFKTEMRALGKIRKAMERTI